MKNISNHTKSYLETALWSSELDSFCFDDIRPEHLLQAEKDCSLFIQKAGDLLNGLDLDQVMHDFWLTRNGHGAGFWDGDYEKDIGDRLTELSKEFGELVCLESEVDGKIFIE